MSYILDAQNRRLAKLINSRIIKRYVYLSATQLGAEIDEHGQIITSYVYASKSNISDYVVSHNHTYRLISDQVGTPLMLVDSDSGKVVEDYDFDEYGLSEQKDRFFGHEFRFGRGTPVSIAFGYAGGLYDQDTGLIHFGAREYDPEIGRWTSKDPIGFSGGDTNLYGYVLNDPVNGVDPSGKVIGIDDIILTIGGTAFVGGVINGVAIYRTTHSKDAAIHAFITGAIGGALAGASALWGNYTYISGLVGTIADLIITIANAPDNLPSGSTEDYINGIHTIINSSPNTCTSQNGGN